MNFESFEKHDAESQEEETKDEYVEPDYRMTEIDDDDEYDEGVDYQVVDPSEIAQRGQIKAAGKSVVSMRAASVNNITEDDFYQGMLWKQQPVFPRRWQKRFFVLDTKVLKYYKSKQDYETNKLPKGVINFQQIWVEAELVEKEFKINLSMKGSKRVFNLRCANELDFGQWSSKLRHSINSSLGL